MASNTKLADFHVRGMTDVAAAPGVEIATLAVEQWGDGSIRATKANGEVLIITDPAATKLLSVVLGIPLFHL